MPSFKGKAPGAGAGEISRRTQALRPTIALGPKQRDRARQLRRQGHEPEAIAKAMELPVEEIEKALVQMRMPRPETTRGTLNVTLDAHKLVMTERKGDEPIWVTMDRLLNELLRLRAERDRPRRLREDQAALPLFGEGAAKAGGGLGGGEA